MTSFTSRPWLAAALLFGTLVNAQGNPTAEIVQQLREKNYDSAVRLADAALKMQPDDPRLWTLKGMALSATSGKVTAAVSAFEQALKLAPTYLPALEAAAQAEYTSSDPRARAHLDGVLAQQPQNPTAHAMLAVLDFQAGNFAAAATHFSAAQPVIYNQPLALSQYGASLAISGDTAAAIPVLTNALALQPDNDLARYNLALAEFRINQASDAVAQLAPLLSKQDPPEETLTLAAEANEELGRTQQAVDLLRRSILLYPKNPDAYIYLAHLSFAHSSVQVGIDVLNAGIVQLPNEPRLYLSRGILFGQLAKNEQSAADFDKAAALDPKLTLTGTARGVAQSQQHHDEEALATFRVTARTHPTDALTQYLLAEALSNLSPQPDTKDGQEEMKAALAAVTLDPNMADAQDLLATIYLRQQEFAKAAEHSKAALRVRPDDQQALYHLVLAARKGIDRDQLPALVKRLAASHDASPSSAEGPKGYLVVARDK